MCAEKNNIGGTNLTPEDKQQFENGLRILARWIARAYIRDQQELRQAQLGIQGEDREQSVPRTIINNNVQQAKTEGHQKISKLKNKVKNLPEERLGFTVKEAAKSLGVHPTSIYEAVKAGQIRSVRVGKRIVIPKESLVEFLSKI